MIFHPEIVAIATYALFGSFAVILFSLLTKYTMYAPGDNAEGKSMQTGIFVLFLTIPFLAPISLIWLARNTFRARKNLVHYFPTELPND